MLKILKWYIILDYLGSPDVVTSILIRAGQEIRGVVRDMTTEAKVGVKQGRSHEPGNTESF